MAKNIPLKRYLSGSDSLYLTQQFIYQVDIYKLSNRRYELVNSRNFALAEYKDINKCTSTKLDNGDIIFKEVTLIGAPEKYLIEHNYFEQ